MASAYPLQEPGQVGTGELPAERPGGLVVAAGEGQQGSGELGRAGEVVGRDDLFCTMEKKTSIWFSQEACTGVWIMIAFG
jgi:hypothetical protein